MTWPARLDDPFTPPLPPRASGLLARGLHSIAWREFGNPEGMPVIACHGGPGGASPDGVTRFIDAQRYRIVQFDQRGCGRSTPIGALAENTLADTIADMEALRAALGIETWLVTGGSWGSTVALAYAEAHPDRTLGLFLIATWLCRARDTAWWFEGVRTLFPELWENFAGAVPEAERHDLRAAYCRRILDGPADNATDFATRLFLYEEGFMRFDAPLIPPDPARGAAYGRIFAHYARHDFFLRENQLLQDAPRIAHLPALLITGRYDCCTPPEGAHALARVLPRAELRIVPAAGHYPTDPAMARACAGALDVLAARIGA